MKLKNTLIGLILCTGAYAQDVHFSQMEYAPLLLNPAIAGSNSDINVSINYRNQWSAVADPFSTFAGSYDMRLTKNDRNQFGYLSGGIQFYNDQMNRGSLTTNSALLALAYQMNISSGNRIGIGLYGGMMQRSLNSNNETFGAQYDGTAFNSSLPTGETFTNQSFGAIDAGAGINYSFDDERMSGRRTSGLRINAGFAAYHINQPTYSFISSSAEKLAMRLSGYVNASLPLSNQKVRIEPGVYTQFQGNASLIMFGSYAKFQLQNESMYTGNKQESSLGVGFFYRNKDAVIAKLLIEWSGLSLGFAYDINTSSLSTASNSRGGMELLLNYKIGNLRQGASKIR